MEGTSPQQSQVARGIFILGAINIGWFGILLLANLLLYVSLTIKPQLFETITELIKSRGIEATFTYTTVKTATLIQMVICFLYVISGVGVIKRKQWGRKFTIYFASIYVLVLFILTILQPPIVRYTFFRIIYPGILIWYFTNKKILHNFS